jgi:hypothetical protein
MRRGIIPLDGALWGWRVSPVCGVLAKSVPVHGQVVAAVTGVTIHAGTLTVNASVQNGRYAAWWLGPAFQSGPLEPSGEGGPKPILTYDLTLTDGTVIHNAQPALP